MRSLRDGLTDVLTIGTIGRHRPSYASLPPARGMYTSAEVGDELGCQRVPRQHAEVLLVPEVSVEDGAVRRHEADIVDLG